MGYHNVDRLGVTGIRTVSGSSSYLDVSGFADILAAEVGQDRLKVTTNLGIEVIRSPASAAD